MVEAAAEANEELMNKYLESERAFAEEIKKGIRIRTINNEIVPMLCGSAFKNRACSDARRRDRLPALARGHPAGEGSEREGRADFASPGDTSRSPRSRSRS